MQLRGLLDALPLWGLFAATVVIVLLSFEGGFRVGGWKSRWSQQEQEVVARTMVGAMLGLLALMLAFTFGMAASRFDARRQALLDETNAIRATYLRAELLSEPYSTEIRDLLGEYVDVRLEGIRSRKIEQVEGIRSRMTEQGISPSEELHNRLWYRAAAAKEKASSPIFAGHFHQSLNEMVALHKRRVMIGWEFRIPGIIWLVLYTITALAVASIGYHAGLTRTSRSFLVPAFALIFSAVMLLIADLDRPLRWLLEDSEHALVDLQKTMIAPKH